MKIVLSEIELDGYPFPEDVRVEIISNKSVNAFDHDGRVVAVVGSRAMASKCAKMDLPGLKLYQLTSAGYDGVPCEEYAGRGISVANAGTVYSTPIAETVVFGMLSVAKKLRNNPNNRRLKYLRHYKHISELSGKNVLILGAGSIGTAIAQRLAGFDMRIDGYDPYCIPKEQYSKILRTREDLLGSIGNYDYVVSTLPDTPQTRAFVNQELLEKMKRTAVFVNVGRKVTIQEDDLYTALKKRHIAGAVLDMFEKFPNPITNRFRCLRNVIVLPGVAAISKEVRHRLKKLVYENVLCALEETTVLYVINGVK